MSAYFLAAVNIRNAQEFQKYAEAGFASMQGYNFEVLSIDDNAVVLEGDLPAHHMVLLKFDSKADLQKWWNSDGYAKAKPFRHASADTSFCLALDHFNPA